MNPDLDLPAAELARRAPRVMHELDKHHLGGFVASRHRLIEAILDALGPEEARDHPPLALTGRVQVAVSDEDGNPVEGVTVTVWEEVARGTTGKNGRTP